MSPRNTQFTRDDIIEAAFGLVRQKGWDGFSVVAVAKAIGSSTMPIYSHFGNVRDLEDAVCRKTMTLLKSRMEEVLSGDTWIDQAISYIGFAQDEKFLFRCLWDGRNVELTKLLGKELNEFISERLSDYPLFKGLDEQELKMIRLSRMMFAQKLAYWLNTNGNYLIEKGIPDTNDYIRRASRAIYDGFRLQFSLKQ